MKAFIFILMAVTVITGVGALGTGMGTTRGALFAPLCLSAIVSGVLFLYLAARQSRLNKQ